MAAQFSEGWSGTPMWKIAQEREAREAKEAKKASTPVAVLSIRSEGDRHLCDLTLLTPMPASSKPTAQGPAGASAGYREVRVRGPRRPSRREALQDGFELRAGFHEKGEAEVHRRRRSLQGKVWPAPALPREDAPVEESGDAEQRQRLAARPRGTGWSRQGDAEFFVHTHSPMAYSPAKVQYFMVDQATTKYVPCEPPHDPTEYPITVNANSSLVGRCDDDLVSADRPRTLLLKELVKTGAAMKHPLFFLDQPSACFAMFEGIRGGAAVELCSKQFHTKLLPRLSSCLQYWTAPLLEELFLSIVDELEAHLLLQPGACYDGVSMGVALLLGDRLVLATLGGVRGLLLSSGGAVQRLGSQHLVLEEGPERQRIEATFGDVVRPQPPTDGAAGDKAAQLGVRRPLTDRDTAPNEGQSEEIDRILERAPDVFATLGLGVGSEIDGKAGRAAYKKLALKVHPDKAPDALKERAQEAFAKVEAAAERVEACWEADSIAAAELHRILEAAQSVTSALMPRIWACEVLGIDMQTATLDDAEARVEELRRVLARLGQFTDGRFAHADAARAGRLLDEALEVLVAPAAREGSAFEAVPVTRALGLRDLKKPRPIVVARPQVEIVQLEAEGIHHFVLLSSGADGLDDASIAERVRAYARHPKSASLVVAQDASQRLRPGGPRTVGCVVGVLEVGDAEASASGTASSEPAAKRSRTVASEANKDRVRCRHILLKHKDLKVKIDKDSRLKGPSPRSVAEAERELFQIKISLASKPGNFHTLARKHSECQTALQPGQNAGDLGWVSRGCYPDPQLEAIQFALRVHEVSDIVSTTRGLHVVQRIA